MNSFKQKKMKNKYRFVGFLFLLPATLIYLVFTIFPFFDSVLLSFQEWNGFTNRSFIGAENYLRAIQDKVFLKAVSNSVYLGFASSILSVSVGVVLAWILLYTGKKRGTIYRTILFSPSMIPPVITGLIFAFVFEPDMGVLNQILHTIGLGQFATAWLSNKATALGCILFVAAWKQVGLTMVLCFASMQGLNISVIESARVDGATEIAIFRKIIIPLIMPIIQLSAIFALTSGLKIYDTVVTLTAGGPAKSTIVMPLWILQNAYAFNKYGYAAAMSIIFVLVVLLGTIVVKKTLRGDSYEQ